MRLLPVAIITAVLVVLSADAAEATLCERAREVRTDVIHTHGHRAVGDNICFKGTLVKRQWDAATESRRKVYREATWREKDKYMRHMRYLLKPWPYMLVKAVGPRHEKSRVLRPTLQPYGLSDCIAYHESGYNPQAVNGQYHGVAQWSPTAWAQHGGHRFASDPLGATLQQQYKVLSYGLEHYGCAPWCPYDGCG